MGQKTVSSVEAELVQVFSSWEVSHLPHSVTEWLEEFTAFPYYSALEQTSPSEKKGRYIERCRISLILFTAKISLSSSSNSSVSTTNGNKNLQLRKEKKFGQGHGWQKKKLGKRNQYGLLNAVPNLYFLHLFNPFITGLVWEFFILLYST